MVNTSDLINMMADLEEDNLIGAITEISKNPEGVTQAMEAMQKGLEIVGERFEKGDYFVGDLIYAGEIMSEALEIIKPLINTSVGGNTGKIILCTVKGDIHDIGKNIVKALFEAAGFEVNDLGIDVPSQKVVQAAKEQNVKIIALSGVLTLAINSMKEVVDLCKEAGIRNKVKILIGGNPVSEENCKMIGADDWAHSPQKGVNICKIWAAE